jgi:hypothetical protein
MKNGAVYGRHNSVTKSRLAAKTRALEEAVVNVLTALNAAEVAGATRSCNVTCRRRYEVPGTEPHNPTRGGAARRPSSRGAQRQAAHLQQRHEVGDISVTTR